MFTKMITLLYVDIVEPTGVQSFKGFLYILTFIGLCTRWVKGVPLRYFITEEVTNALLSIIWRVGFPDVTLLDNGSNLCFLKCVLSLVYCLLHKRLVLDTNPNAKWWSKTYLWAWNKCWQTSPTTQFPEDWNLYLPAFLFAYLKVIQRNKGFSRMKSYMAALYLVLSPFWEI